MKQTLKPRLGIFVQRGALVCALAAGAASARAQSIGGDYTPSVPPIVPPSVAQARLEQTRAVGVLVEGRRLLYAETSAVSPGSAGNGYRAIDIVQATPGLILADTRGYLVSNNTITANANESMLGNASTFGASTLAYWINPATLARLPLGRVGARTISRVRFNQGGQILSAVSILDQSATDYASDIYDLASGLLLSSSRANTSSGRRVSSTSRFFGARSLGVPWASQPAPSWAAAGRQLFYQGSLQNVLLGSSLPPLPASPASMTFVLTRALGNAVQARQSVVTQSSGIAQTSNSDRVFGSAGLSPLWIPPAAIATLRAGQVLDQDSVTRFRTVYAGVQNNVAVLVEQGPTQSFTSFYSRQNGMLVGVQNNTRTLNLGEQRITLNLVGVR